MVVDALQSKPLSEVRPVKSPTASLAAHYAAIERGLRLRWSPNYGSLVVPNGNANAPVHRWFHQKEAFSSLLLTQVLADTRLKHSRGLRVLDPFAGVGTTAVSVAEAVCAGELRSPCVYGVESNPFLHLVAATKLAALQHGAATFCGLARRIAAKVLDNRVEAPPVPDLSTFNRDGFFDPKELRRLLSLREAINLEEAAGAHFLDIALARVCLGSVVEAVSSLRRDGRALRRVAKRVRTSAIQAFLHRAHEIASDLPEKGTPVRGRILLGDGRLLESIDGRFEPFDLVLFSPPYPNNIDYTEVYKLENWLLGLIKDEQAFRTQRLRTVYSHPSLLRSDPLPSQLLSNSENGRLEETVAPLISALPSDRYTQGRTRMLRGYLLDMYLTLSAARSRLRPRGHLVYVVGNSIHGRPPHALVIAADLLIAHLAEFAGFSVSHVAVARYLRRRLAGSHYLRESAVFLRRID